jgi:hypothetical protein
MEDDEAFEKDQPSDENHCTISLRLQDRKPSVAVLGTSTFFELQNIQSGRPGSHDPAKNHQLYRCGLVPRFHQKLQKFELSGQLDVDGLHSKGQQFQRRQSGQGVHPWMQT